MRCAKSFYQDVARFSVPGITLALDASLLIPPRRGGLRDNGSYGRGITHAGVRQAVRKYYDRMYGWTDENGQVLYAGVMITCTELRFQSYAKRTRKERERESRAVVINGCLTCV